MKFKPKATPPLDNGQDYAEPDRMHKELIDILQELQKKFVPHSDFHNKLTKAIKLAQ